MSGDDRDLYMRVRFVYAVRIWRQWGIGIIMGKLLTRGDLAEARKRNAERTTDLDVPEWGGSVRLRTMTGTERDAYEAEITGTRRGKDQRLNLSNVRARMVARCMVDDKGAAVFDWRNPKDIDELGAMDAAGLDRVFQKCQEINGLTQADVDDLTGNLKAGPNGVSGSN